MRLEAADALLVTYWKNLETVRVMFVSVVRQIKSLMGSAIIPTPHTPSHSS